jgi:hypothetical protein
MTDRPSIAELRCRVEESRAGGGGLLLLRDAAPALLEIVEAALEMQTARDEYRSNQAVTCEKLGRAHNVLANALAKVRP